MNKPIRQCLRASLLFMLVGPVLLSVPATAVQAQTDHVFEVNSLADSSRQSGAPEGTCATGATVSCPSGQCAECTLRAAIETANDLSFGQSATVAFADYIPTNSSNPPASMFEPVNGYNSLGREVHIEGTTHPDWDPVDGIPAVIIRGDEAIATAHGLNFGPGAAGSVVDAVAVYNFPQAGIRINADNVTVSQSHIGVNAGGTSARPNAVGVLVLGDGNVIGHQAVAPFVAPWPNVISGNDGHGVIIEGHNNLVGGNLIGLNKAGTSALGNAGSGIRVEGTNARIGDQSFSGGDFPLLQTAPNVVAGNTGDQVRFESGASAGEVACTGIGTNASGDARVGFGTGIALRLNSSSNQVGNDQCRNLFAGQVAMGQGGDSPITVNFNTFEHNFVGTNVDGADLGEDLVGVFVNSGQGHQIRNNTIGNGLTGIGIGTGVVNTIIQSNHIGVDANGNALPLLFDAIRNGGSGTVIGGSDQALGNRLGHAARGIENTVGSSAAIIQNNRIGALADGTAAPVGTAVRVSGENHQVGIAGSGNRIANAEQAGIELIGNSADALVRGNLIGSTSRTAGGFGDNAVGILVSGSDHVISDQNRVGSQHTAILVEEGSHQIIDNRIGFDEDLTPRPNSSFGIRLASSDSSRVIGNQVGFSTRGIRLNTGATGTVVGNNWLGLTPDMADIGNSLYGYYATGAFNFLGTDPNTGESMPNVVGFNGSGGGVRIGGADNLVINNFIGIGPDGQSIPNGGSGGLVLLDDPAGSQIGLSTGTNANFIGNNLGAGIEIRASVATVSIAVNRIGQGPTLQAAGNQGPGIALGPGVSDIDMLSPPTMSDFHDSLRIVGNAGDAIAFDPDAGTGNRIQRLYARYNQGKAIDLGPGGRDQDPGDADTGPNNLQNFPEIVEPTFRDPDADTMTVTFRVDSDPGNASYPLSVDIYAYDDGQRGGTDSFRWYGSVLYPESEAGEFLTATLPRPDHWTIIPIDIVASATDALGNTSEMSEPFSMADTYTIGGTVVDLTGSGLVLQNNGADDLVVAQSGTFPFVFDTPLTNSDPYNVTIAAQPDGQFCTVENGSGTVIDSDIDDIEVICQATDDEIFRDRFEPTAMRGQPARTRSES